MGFWGKLEVRKKVQSVQYMYGNSPISSSERKGSMKEVAAFEEALMEFDMAFATVLLLLTHKGAMQLKA